MTDIVVGKGSVLNVSPSKPSNPAVARLLHYLGKCQDCGKWRLGMCFNPHCPKHPDQTLRHRSIPDLPSITLYAHDDLMTRAEKIVFVMGYRGAVGNYVLIVYRILQKYEELDRHRSTVPQPGCPEALAPNPNTDAAQEPTSGST